jgi:hypothetical protein
VMAADGGGTEVEMAVFLAADDHNGLGELERRFSETVALWNEQGLRGRAWGGSGARSHRPKSCTTAESGILP